jgi:hypothetical protein
LCKSAHCSRCVRERLKLWRSRGRDRAECPSIRTDRRKENAARGWHLSQGDVNHGAAL